MTPAPVRPDRRALLIYDGECGFCRGTARRLKHLDRARRLRFRPLQDERLYVDDPRLDRLACEKSVHLVAEDSTIHVGGAAFREAAARVGAASVTWILELPVARQITELAYRVVAGNRGRISL